MGALRLRSAEPGPHGLDEYFGRLPASALADPHLSDESKVCLAAIYLSIAVNRSGLCLDTNAELGKSINCTPRSIKRRLAQLEQYGHIVREPVRTIAGAPRGIRALAKLRGARQVFGGTAVSPQGGTAVSPQGDSSVTPS